MESLWTEGGVGVPGCFAVGWPLGRPGAWGRSSAWLPPSSASWLLGVCLQVQGRGEASSQPPVSSASLRCAWTVGPGDSWLKGAWGPWGCQRLVCWGLGGD